MRKKTIIGTLLLTLTLTALFLVLQSSSRPVVDSPDKEALDASCQKESKDGKMIFENLSHQFFSSL